VKEFSQAYLPGLFFAPAIKELKERTLKALEEMKGLQ
jgi:hypothetical protein